MISDTQNSAVHLSTGKKELLRRLKKQEGLVSSEESTSLKPLARQEGELFSLSFAQQRLWLLDQLDPGAAIYNIPLALRLRGQVDTDALTQALTEIVRRHEALRTAFVAIDGVPWQTIVAATPFQLPIIRLDHLDIHDRQARALQMVTEEAERPFDLTAGELLHGQFLKLDEEEYILNLSMHHIASDAWSVELFCQEALTLYQDFVAGRASSLPELPLQYIDYAVWQRQWLQGKMLERQIDYWKKQLHGSPALLQLPTDQPRPAQQTFRGATTTFQISPRLTAELKELSQREGVTLFMTLLSVFKVWLAHHTQQDDIPVGTPIANRQRRELEPLIGFFINTLVLRTNLSGDPGFREVLQRVREVTLDGFSHREIPFEMVVDALQVERNLSYSPLFQVLFTLQTELSSSLQPQDLAVTQIHEENKVAKFDLLLALVEEEKDGVAVLTGDFEYNCDLFAADTIDRFVQRFQTLLETLVSQPELPLSKLAWFSAAERDQVLSSWNKHASAVSQDKLIHQFFEAQAERTPGQLALSAHGVELSYAQIEQQANQLAHVLRQRGVGPEVIVGLCLPRSADLIIALLAILKAGGAYLPLDPNYPAERLHFQYQDAQASLLITNSAQTSLWEGAIQPETTLLLDVERADIAQAETSRVTEIAGNLEQLAYIIYTSGSTGRPKGVCITHRNAETLISWGQHEYSSDDLRGVLAGTSICFDLSVFEIFVPLSVGGTIYLVENALHLPTGSAREQITLLNTVPSVMRQLLQSESIPQSVRVINLAGEPLPQVLVQNLYQRPHIERIYNLYGPTEDTTYSTGVLVSRDNTGEPSIGRALDQRQVYLLDEHGTPLPVGVIGEIYLGGVGVTRGYLGRPELTAERYIPDPFSERPGARLYRTGDLARWTADGELLYLGRRDHQVKLRGFRIELGEIEHSLSQHTDIQLCAVVVRQDLTGIDQALVAYILPRTGIELSTAALRTFLQQTLPEHMLPTIFVFQPTLPQTASGKIDRQALLATPLSIDTDIQEKQLPRDSVEEALAEIWRQVLGRTDIGIHDNFFERGGHSLLGAQVISRLRTMLGVEVPLRRLFETPTIEGLAEAVVQARQEEHHLLQPPITRVPRDWSKSPAIPLSYAQQRLWILDRLDPNTTTYNMPFAWNISGQLDRAALEHSLSEIVSRHAILRTAFPIKDDTPVQAITRSGTFMSLPFTDLSHLPSEERPLTATRLLTAEAEQPFQLASGPLWRTHLIRIDDVTHVLFICMHHIISDGWSLNVIRRELAALYTAFAAGKDSTLAPLHLQYLDYTIWQRNWLQGDILDRQLSYWKKQLAGAPDLLSLPTDRPRGAVQNFRGANYQFEISPEVTDDLKALGYRAGTTLFMTLFSAFQVFLNRYSGQDDIVVGTPIANRTQAETEGLIGFFVNTLALRTDLSNDPSFLDVLQRVRQTVLDAFAYQDLPFEQVVEAIQPERDLGRSPLIQVMFVIQMEASQGQDKIDLAPLNVTQLPINQDTAKFDLTLAVNRNGQGLTAEFEYNTDLFDEDTIVRMGTHFQTLLHGIIDDPTQSIAYLPLITHEERELLQQWNATEQVYSTRQLVFELVEEQARLNPEAPALWDQGRAITYARLNRQANQLARVLQEQGVEPGRYVGIYVQRSIEMIVGLLAIFKAGAAYLPIDPSTPPARATFMLTEADVALVLTQKTLLPRLTNCPLPRLTLEQAWEQLGTHSDENLPRSITPDYPAYVIYTSGSTGAPKGVIINHRALLNLIFWHQQAFELTAADKSTQLANLGFDAAVAEIWPYLTIGAHLYLVDEKSRLSPNVLVPWLAKHEITVAYLPTALVEMALHLKWPPSTTLRLLLTGGDQLHRTPSADLPFTLINQYGPTENTVAASWIPITSQPLENRLPVIGRPITNTQLYVLNRVGEIQPIGVPGELFIGGKSVAQGYLGKPGLTARSFMNDSFSGQPGARLYQTGDMARYLPDGTLEFLGRRDHQIKIRGFRIELGEIEMLLLSYPGVHEAVVVLSESLSGEKRLMAYVVPQENVTLTKDKLRTYLKEQLPDYMLPASFSLLDELPLTAHGKVDRQTLSQRRALNASTPEQYIAPRDAIELQLASLWERLLGISPIGITDNFFQSGGHSLLGVRLLSQIQRLFQIDLPLSTLFEGATIAQLSEIIRQQGEQTTSRSLVEIQSTGQQTPLFCMHAVGGEVLSYMQLAHHLGTDQPVYGLQSFAVHALQERAPSIEEMASHYIEAIRTQQPEGPYQLCGWSIGGIIAFEMARQLQASGQHVSFLGIIDSYLPSADEDESERTLLAQFISDLVKGADTTFIQSAVEIPDVSAETQLEYLLLEVQRANILPSGVDLAYITRLFTTFKKNRAAFSQYTMQAYTGPVNLFQASAFSQNGAVEITHGWNQFATQIRATHTLPGDHYTILQDPHAEVLARQIRSHLQQREQAEQADPSSLHA